MKYLFSAILFVHGAIHLLGFVKAFNLAQLPGLMGHISKMSGFFWLVAALLLVSAGIGFLRTENWWSWLAILSALLSLVLVISVWKEAKFAIIPNLLILVVASVSVMTGLFNNKTDAEIRQMLGRSDTTKLSIISKEDISGLPYPVKRWLEVSGVVGKEKTHSVWLKQQAKMKMKPEQDSWTHAVAEQYFTVQNPAFVWRVQMKMPPFIQIVGRDRFVDGKGEMLIKMFSVIDVVNEKGPKMNEGTIQRFLGEIVWFPSAAISPYITWEAIDAYTAKATMAYKGTKGSGIFYFNEKGDFVRYSALRYKGNEPDAIRYEWEIKVTEHAVMNNIKIPVKMTATWKLDEGDWIWLDLEIVDIKYNID